MMHAVDPGMGIDMHGLATICRSCALIHLVLVQSVSLSLAQTVCCCVGTYHAMRRHHYHPMPCVLQVVWVPSQPALPMHAQLWTHVHH